MVLLRRMLQISALAWIALCSISYVTNEWLIAFFALVMLLPLNAITYKVANKKS